MAPQSRDPPPSFGHSQSTPNLPSLDGFQTARDIAPDERTPPPPPLPHPHLPSTSRHVSTSSSSSSSSSSSASSAADFQSHYSLSGSTSSESSSDAAHAFAPPFYNRPPTPLPPSPSLTSLLRPTFSTTTSRPTTPDSSDNDTPNDTEAAVAKSARTATTVPRASPKVPTYEYYGFVLYLGSSLAFVIYLLWSYLPSPFLHQLGIYYYPNRWWSLAIPAFLVMCLIYIYVALALYNIEVLTLPMCSIENIVDEAAQVAGVDGRGRGGLGRKGGGGARRRGGRKGGDAGRSALEWMELWGRARMR
ncbi:MAG: PIG-P protein [Lasallia pustulata]|uniref:PIG-P protein n=1 Tax=Lasallia pustulata TaxID=136370 RepID=A0A5M8PUP7_9LECA|nr:MAG: PIG-P protein [Lasallia pustulata]